jgi:integrase
MSLKIEWRNGVAYLHGTIDHKRIRKSLGTRDPQVAARKKAEEEARLQRAAIYGVEHEATFADACVQYLEHQAPRRHYLKPILHKIGMVKLAQIKPGLIKKIARELYPRCKPQTLNRYVIVPVSAVMNHAHDLGMCPPIRIRRLKPEDEKIKIAVTREWIDRFRAHAVTPYHAAYALFVHTTAARSTEAMMLRPQDLNLETRHGFSAVKTKTGNRREFWLTEEMAEELKRLPPKQIRKGQYKGEWRVFGWSDCMGPIPGWHETCRRAGLDYVSPYEAGRHSFATEAVTRQSQNVVMTAKVGNWADPRVLLKNYAHPEDMAGFADRVFGSHSTQPTTKNLKIIK